MSTRILPGIYCALAVITAGTAILAGPPKARAEAEGLDQRAATYVKSLQGAPYTYGGTGRGGFDCSGLTQYVYGRSGAGIGRTAEAQFRQFRPISRARAWGGDLVFFHQTSDPRSHVYHVGVYEGGHVMVAASAGAGRVRWESFSWAGNTVTFGTITH
ncbi:MAG: NlpC/P60 family protein [Streptosporangiales bacterium]|nr:NlpC/P60 family protein [Streptosporangiales bacterium]